MANVNTNLSFVAWVPTGAVQTLLIPVKERCKVTGVRVVTSPERGATKAVEILKGATRLGLITALSRTAGDVNVAEMEKFSAKDSNATIIEKDGVIKITIADGDACHMAFQIDLDPFCVQQFHIT